MEKKSRIKAKQFIKLALLLDMKVDGMSFDQIGGVSSIRFYDFLANKHICIYNDDSLYNPEYLGTEIKKASLLKEFANIALAHDYINEVEHEEILSSHCCNTNEYNKLADNLYKSIVQVPIKTLHKVKYAQDVEFNSFGLQKDKTYILHGVGGKHLIYDGDLNALEAIKVKQTVLGTCQMLERQMTIVKNDCLNTQRHLVEDLIR